MKWRAWIGGVLLVMMLLGILGCGKKRDPVIDDMVDGPGMMYTPEDQSPFAGSWQSRNGEPDFASDAWVYKTGNVKLTQEHKDILMTGTFDNLTFSHAENAFRIRYSDGSGHRWLTKDGAACGEEDVIFSTESKTPLSKEWNCPNCETRNEGKFCTNCGIRQPFCCKSCGRQPTNEKIPVYCPECGSRLK